MTRVVFRQRRLVSCEGKNKVACSCGVVDAPGIARQRWQIATDGQMSDDITAVVASRQQFAAAKDLAMLSSARLVAASDCSTFPAQVRLNDGSQAPSQATAAGPVPKESQTAQMRRTVLDALDL